jgi:hypothetical protein
MTRPFSFSVNWSTWYLGESDVDVAIMILVIAVPVAVSEV